MGGKILILDFGSQTTMLIARRVREQRVYSEIHPFNVGAEFVREFAPAGIILSGVKYIVNHLLSSFVVTLFRL